jgi:Fe-S-cluster-containing hydrogenase component 2
MHCDKAFGYTHLPMEHNSGETLEHTQVHCRHATTLKALVELQSTFAGPKLPGEPTSMQGTCSVATERYGFVAPNQLLQQNKRWRTQALRRAGVWDVPEAVVSLRTFRVARNAGSGRVPRAGFIRRVLALSVRHAREGQTLDPSAAPRSSLESGTWFKLICGASFNEVTEIAPLTRDYALAGADCVDCAAEPAVVQAVLDGLDEAERRWRWTLTSDSSCARPDRLTKSFARPWIMVSITDDEMEPHFRKARVHVDAHAPCWQCPAPCAQLCPADAFTLPATAKNVNQFQIFGISSTRCYGCGRCIPACPYHLIETHSSKQTPQQVMALVRNYPIDAVEVHTRDPLSESFAALWYSEIGRTLRATMKLIAISMPEPNDWSVFEYIARLVYGAHVDESGTVQEAPATPPSTPILLWQCDGKPMTGDLGAPATTRATVRYATSLAEYFRRNPHLLAARGFIQCAGGTNAHTIPLLEGVDGVHGVAYGGYARRLVATGGYEAAQRLVQQVKTRLVSPKAANREAVQPETSL